jgi:hypothetical protein
MGGCEVVRMGGWEVVRMGGCEVVRMAGGRNWLKIVHNGGL